MGAVGFSRGNDKPFGGSQDISLTSSNPGGTEMLVGVKATSESSGTDSNPIPCAVGVPLPPSVFRDSRERRIGTVLSDLSLCAHWIPSLCAFLGVTGNLLPAPPCLRQTWNWAPSHEFTHVHSYRYHFLEVFVSVADFIDILVKSKES